MSDTDMLAAAIANPSKLIEPDPKDIVLCTYPSTLDGRAAAWVVRKIAKTHNIPVEFSSIDQQLSDLKGRNWIAIGDTNPWPTGVGERGVLAFSELDLLSRRAIPFSKWERTFPFGIKSMVEEGQRKAYIATRNTSFSTATWDFFHADRVGFDPRPRLLNALDDVVTGSFKFKDSREIVACVESYDTTFATLDKLVEACDDRKRRDFMVVGGQAILRYVEKQEAK